MERQTVLYDGLYVPKDICTIDRLGGADDCQSCDEVCMECDSNCRNCAIAKAMNKLGKYENMHEEVKKRIEKIKASADYPHNFKGQMIEDLEWVLAQIN
jgi:hypothetical protein